MSSVLDKYRSLFSLQVLKRPTLNITRIPLPSDFLEKRTLIEMMAFVFEVININFSFRTHRYIILSYCRSFVRPNLFVEIPLGDHSEDRMINVVAFYLSGFSSMRGDSTAAKKPCNSILGEVQLMGSRLSEQKYKSDLVLQMRVEGSSRRGEQKKEERRVGKRYY
jgi:hypothetical protein